MTHSILDLLRNAVVHYGYWAVAVVLLLENGGVPAPGETVLLYASFLAYSQKELQLPWIMVVGTLAATTGDNLGFALGYHGGRGMLERHQRLFRISPATLARGEQLFERFGPITIFFARFIFGMRILAGPLAGVLRMPWPKFALWNFLGAALWVATISTVGYLFGRHWQALEGVIKRFDVAGVILVAVGVWIWWLRRRRNGAGHLRS